MFALGNGRWDCAEAMMASEKVDYSCVDSAGRGLMHRAVVMCDVKQCAELIKRGADFKTADCSKVTPLHLAAKTGNLTRAVLSKAHYDGIKFAFVCISVDLCLLCLSARLHYITDAGNKIMVW